MNSLIRLKRWDEDTSYKMPPVLLLDWVNIYEVPCPLLFGNSRSKPKEVLDQISKSKKQNWAISTLVSPIQSLHHIKLSISTKLYAAIRTCNKTTMISLLEACLEPVPQSKNSTRGIFRLVSLSHPCQCIKLPTSTNFHDGIMICSKTSTILLLEARTLVPQSKNSTRGRFSACVHITSFSAHQTAYLYQFPCWYHIWHDCCTKHLYYN